MAGVQAYLRNLELQYLKNQLDTVRLPIHLGMILDGNRRFAQSVGVSRKEGHSLGIKKFHDLLTWAYKHAIKYVTIWVFSSENWEREEEEVIDITELFIQETSDQIASGEFVKRGIRFRAIGDYSHFPKKLHVLLRKLEEVTKHGTKMILNVAIGYGGRQEILHATNTFIKTNPGKSITEDALTEHTYLAGQPTPDLIIRTSGEKRHSGFVLWHSPYAEYYFSPILWPAFREVDFTRALIDYQNRKRRFGK